MLDATFLDLFVSNKLECCLKKLMQETDSNALDQNKLEACLVNIKSMIQYVMRSLQIEAFFDFCERTIQDMYCGHNQHQLIHLQRRFI
jgi:hypothetical protein